MMMGVSVLVLSVFATPLTTAVSTLDWLLEAATAGSSQTDPMFLSGAHVTPQHLVVLNATGDKDQVKDGQPSWVADATRLAARLDVLQKKYGDKVSPRAWPLGTEDYDTKVGVDNVIFAEPPEQRCARLATKPISQPTSRSPIAVLLAGQLRTAEIALPFLELNLIKASMPRPVHVFAHVWAPHKQPPPPPLKNTGRIRDLIRMGDGKTLKELADPLAGERAVAKLRRMPGVKAVVEEPAEDGPEIIKHFYDSKYGDGWTVKRGSQITNFLSQWYKVSAGHGLLRRWYRDQALHNSSYTDGPPLVIVRMRPDHVLRVRWNLTLATLEFQARAAAKAAGGNFLSVWGPTSHSHFCGPRLCPDSEKITKAEYSGKLGCYDNGRFDDAFALGTPAAMDAYAAPYHPYAGAKCCEDTVTASLPLANLVPVGAVASAGGLFGGSLSMPGSCADLAGHFPMDVVKLPAGASKEHAIGEGPMFLQYTHAPVSYGAKRGSHPRTVAEFEVASKEELDPSTRRISHSREIATNTDKYSPVPGPFKYTREGGLTDLKYADETTIVATHRYVEANMFPGGRENRVGLSFSQLCAPVFYFAKFGISILRFSDAIQKSKILVEQLQTSGSCAPHLAATSFGKSKTNPKPAKPKPLAFLPAELQPLEPLPLLPDLPASTAPLWWPVRRHCSDIRMSAAAKNLWVSQQLHPENVQCDCTRPTRVDLPDLSNFSTVWSAQKRT